MNRGAIADYHLLAAALAAIQAVVDRGPADVACEMLPACSTLLAAIADLLQANPELAEQVAKPPQWEAMKRAVRQSQ